MGIRLIRNEQRFAIETEEERMILENARNYFGTSRLLLTKGCDYRLSPKACPGFFSKVKNENSNQKISRISVDNWKRIEEYASRFNKNERYDPETFVRPDI